MQIVSNLNVKSIIDFVNTYGQYAIDTGLKYNLPICAILAQAAQETGWGKYILNVYIGGIKVCSNNIFNIKAGSSWTGLSGERVVWEVIDGHNIDIKQYFRVYKTVAEAFDNYGEYITQRKKKDGALLYADALAVRQEILPYITQISKHYATDPNYAFNCQQIVTYFEVFP